MKHHHLSLVAFHVLVGLEGLVIDEAGDGIVSIIIVVRRLVVGDGVRESFA